eukprot:jgi/Phyca11/132529/e_gw1.178.7.1
MTTFATINAAIVDYQEIKPFAQPEPITVSDKVAVRFKPQLRIKDGCHPYPAVNEAGDISSGADSGWGDSSCSGSDVGSQVYGRSAWCGGVWGMMYAWYFPKDETTHRWENVVVWIDDPAVENPTILGVSTSSDGGYIRYAPLDDNDWARDGDNVQIQYRLDDVMATTRVFHHLDTSWRGGDIQGLVTWEQLTEEARNTLENGDFGESKVPLKNSTFTANLDFAIPGSIRKTD